MEIPCRCYSHLHSDFRYKPLFLQLLYLDSLLSLHPASLCLLLELFVTSVSTDDRDSFVKPPQSYLTSLLDRRENSVRIITNTEKKSFRVALQADRITISRECIQTRMCTRQLLMISYRLSHPIVITYCLTDIYLLKMSSYYPFEHFCKNFLCVAKPKVTICDL